MEYNKNTLQFIGKHVLFYKEDLPNKKTPILHILNDNKEVLGYIKWYPRLRKFCLFPCAGIVLDEKHLNDIAAYLPLWNKMWKNKS